MWIQSNRLMFENNSISFFKKQMLFFLSSRQHVAAIKRHFSALLDVIDDEKIVGASIANLCWLRANNGDASAFGTADDDIATWLERLVFAEHDLAALGSAWSIADGKGSTLIDDGPLEGSVSLSVLLDHDDVDDVDLLMVFIGRNWRWNGWKKHVRLCARVIFLTKFEKKRI